MTLTAEKADSDAMVLYAILETHPKLDEAMKARARDAVTQLHAAALFLVMFGNRARDER